MALTQIDQRSLLDSILDEAAAIGVSPAAICRRAGIQYSTWHRWINEGRPIKLTSYNAMVRALSSLRADKLREQLAEAERGAAE